MPSNNAYFSFPFRLRRLSPCLESIGRLGSVCLSSAQISIYWHLTWLSCSRCCEMLSSIKLQFIVSFFLQSSMSESGLKHLRNPNCWPYISLRTQTYRKFWQAMILSLLYQTLNFQEVWEKEHQFEQIKKITMLPDITNRVVSNTHCNMIKKWTPQKNRFGFGTAFKRI